MSDKTNVLFIMTDDQGVWTPGCYGNPDIRTPNLDRLAAEGTRLENFFITTPVCSPSRATFMTGRIPSQHGIHQFLSGKDEVHLTPDAIRYLDGETATTDVIARHGWTCGLSGKWHVGDERCPQHGFTDWFTTFSSQPYHASVCVKDGQAFTSDRYITDHITDEALGMLDRYADAGHPFYLAVNYTAPHTPWGDQPKALMDSYDDCDFASCPNEPPHPDLVESWASMQFEPHRREALKGYASAVTGMDANVGRLLERLDEHGLSDNTLVCFFSDNGFSCGQRGVWGKGNGTDPRNMFENSIRVPTILRHPGRVPAGRVEPAMLSAYDWAPTLLEYLDLPPMPAERDLPGRSFAPALEGKPLEERENVVVFDEYGPVRMIRTKEWKYVYRHAHGPHEFYDLVNDPEERSNLAGSGDHQDIIVDLRKRMDDWFARYAIPSRDGLKASGGREGQTGLCF